jgi:hypothetical protein
MRKTIALGIAATFLGGGLAVAAQQGAAAKKLLLNNPPSGNTKIVYLSKNTTGTVQGNPITNGASFNVVIGGDGTQCMTMPASGWSVIGTQGFKYKDPSLANGPVKVALIKATPSGNFLLKVITKGNTVVPGNPTTTNYGTNFTINSGDEYCASTGTATPTKNTPAKFLVKNDTGMLCTATACSSPSGAFLEVAAAF